MRHRFAILILVLALASQSFAARYLVELTGEPLANHPAVLASRANLDTAPVRRRRSAIRVQQDRVRRAIASYGLVLTRLETISNLLVVEMPSDRAAVLAAAPDILRIQPVRVYKMVLDHALPLHRIPEAWTRVGIANAGAGIRIAVIDSGIDVGHPGLQDALMSPPAGFPKANSDSDLAFTNGKVIVARSYANLFNATETDPSARDLRGHGTAAAMAAAGALNTGPQGPISGAAPKAYLGSYKVFGANGEIGRAHV